jgi:hypothetical protein
LHGIFYLRLRTIPATWSAHIAALHVFLQTSVKWCSCPLFRVSPVLRPKLATSLLGSNMVNRAAYFLLTVISVRVIRVYTWHFRSHSGW